jgi:hypothetical protein
MFVLTYCSIAYESNAFSIIDASNPKAIYLKDFWKVESIEIVHKNIQTDDTSLEIHWHLRMTVILYFVPAKKTSLNYLQSNNLHLADNNNQ